MDYNLFLCINFSTQSFKNLHYQHFFFKNFKYIIKLCKIRISKNLENSLKCLHLKHECNDMWT